MFRIILATCCLLTSCHSASVVWSFHDGCSLSNSEKSSVINLSKRIGFDSVYSVEVGVFNKYDSSVAVVAKQVDSRNDTLRQEKWLYIWKKEWMDSQLFRSFGDSTIGIGGFVSGETAVRVVDKYIYSYGSEKKMFRFATSRGKYSDVKVILDCIKNGVAIEQERKFREETEVPWAIIKNNLLDFTEITCWGSHYSFNYSFSNSSNSELVLEARRIEDNCEIIYAGPRGAGGK